MTRNNRCEGALHILLFIRRCSLAAFYLEDRFSLSMTMLTAETISRIPAIPSMVNRSLNANAPMTTAVKGSMAPNMEVSVGPMYFTAFTNVIFEMAVAGKASPRMYNQA